MLVGAFDVNSRSDFVGVDEAFALLVIGFDKSLGPDFVVVAAAASSPDLVA